jgi:hypothetical protein
MVCAVVLHAENAYIRLFWKKNHTTVIWQLKAFMVSFNNLTSGYSILELGIVLLPRTIQGQVRDILVCPLGAVYFLLII